MDLTAYIITCPQLLFLDTSWMDLYVFWPVCLPLPQNGLIYFK